MHRLDKISMHLNQFLAWVAGCTLAGMMFLTVANMILRAVYRPFGATYEVVGWLTAITTAFALGYTQIYRGHVTIDIFALRLPHRVRAVVESIMFLLSAALFAVATWQIAVYAARLRQIGALSETLHMIFFPIVYVVALGFACFSFVLFVDFLKSISGVIRK